MKTVLTFDRNSLQRQRRNCPTILTLSDSLHVLHQLWTSQQSTVFYRLYIELYFAAKYAHSPRFASSSKRSPYFILRTEFRRTPISSNSNILSSNIIQPLRDNEYFSYFDIFSKIFFWPLDRFEKLKLKIKDASFGL